MTEAQMIEFWKENERPFGLCPKECQEWFRRFCGPIQLFSGSQWSDLGSKCEGTSLYVEKTYRLPSDYRPKKTGRWVECEVFRDGPDWAFIPFWDEGKENSCELVEAPGMVGFGGVEYRGLPGWRQLGYEVNKTEANAEPVAPTKVRFWVEE